MTQKVKSVFTDYWQVLVTIGLVIFNVGFTVAKLDNFVTQDELSKQVQEIRVEREQKIESELKKISDNYIEIERVPGLKEELKSIRDLMEIQSKQLTRIENKLFK